MSSAVLRTDGGARGNPGPAGAAFVLEDGSGTILRAAGRYLGETTNNVAEYQALIWGLEVARTLGISRIRVLCDSELVVKQLNGSYRVKHENMKPLFANAKTLLTQFESWQVVHVFRDQNTAADALVNDAIDARDRVGDADVPSASNPQPSLFEDAPSA